MVARASAIVPPTKAATAGEPAAAAAPRPTSSSTALSPTSGAAALGAVARVVQRLADGGCGRQVPARRPGEADAELGAVSGHGRDDRRVGDAHRPAGQRPAGRPWRRSGRRGGCRRGSAAELDPARVVEGRQVRGGGHAASGWCSPGGGCGRRRPCAGPVRRCSSRRSVRAIARRRRAAVRRPRPGTAAARSRRACRGRTRRCRPVPGSPGRTHVFPPGRVLDDPDRLRRPDGRDHGHARRRGGSRARARPDRRPADGRRRRCRRPTPRRPPRRASSVAGDRWRRHSRWAARSGGASCPRGPARRLRRGGRRRPWARRPSSRRRTSALAASTTVRLRSVEPSQGGDDVGIASGGDAPVDVDHLEALPGDGVGEQRQPDVHHPCPSPAAAGRRRRRRSRRCPLDHAPGVGDQASARRGPRRRAVARAAAASSVRVGGDLGEHRVASAPGPRRRSRRAWRRWPTGRGRPRASRHRWRDAGRAARPRSGRASPG